jgi:hypothetical protein
VSLANDNVSIVRLQHGLGVRLLEKRHAPIVLKPQSKPWFAWISELESLMVQSGTGLPITIVLSNHLVRYKIIPALPAFSPADKALEVATHCFRESYGDIVDGWSVRINPLPHGDTLLISAVDSDLISGIEALCKQNRCKLKSIQPYLMSGFNCARSEIDATACCFVQVETGRLSIALIRDGGWQSITACPITDDWSKDLAALITREMLLADWQNLQPKIYFTALPSIKDEQIKNLFKQSNPAWQTFQLEHKTIIGYLPSEDYPFAISLSATF